MKAYICISTPKASDRSKAGLFVRMLQRVLPAANPDFESFYDAVVVWHVEIDAATGEPLREVGLDAQQRVLVIGPWGENVGVIVDCGGTFDPEEYPQVSAEQFDHEWKSFESEISS